MARVHFDRKTIILRKLKGKVKMGFCAKLPLRNPDFCAIIYQNNKLSFDTTHRPCGDRHDTLHCVYPSVLCRFFVRKVCAQVALTHCSGSFNCAEAVEFIGESQHFIPG